MNTEQALIDACIAEPTDNTRRLAYADWLDEFGNSDRHAARAEWIRLTCTKNRKNTTNRQAGERVWITKNAARLWPSITSMITGRITVSTTEVRQRLVHAAMKTLTGQITFAVSVPSFGSASVGMHSTVVKINCDRGITSSVQLRFLRAASVAKLVAADEPNAPLEMNVPRALVQYDYGSYHWGIPKRAFALRGLSDVWYLLPGDIQRFGGQEEKRFVSVASPASPIHQLPHWIEMVIDKALTHWARGTTPIVTESPGTADLGLGLPDFDAEDDADWGI